ncbi:BREX-1 system adenine-specific DNA-methyltransferase PglX [Microbacterium xanthum]|uniref:BREX-1 system adenine-specific DNA-methyltransferase PglX n=1 Tax=Microbacterium xanthum TaxID=3079794 RepID=UPI002AD38986|nr:BREX-1 system adenine-specific DNA-methyltransferase PglX [Microbacterium sp. KSW-48]MDZ8172436.1 BREX-1 system adenine-specific DNA-methyltransferase PglX [Microbacterium sp. KSW-48]
MDTASLKSFAMSARRELIREVGARITAALAQGSPERVEQPRAVAELERAIAVGGGGSKGRGHVADRVAYTWFNRIIALRFMDANGYTGVGVVSPAEDQAGQPEVLAAAKRGQVDGEVVKGTNLATIAGLLNGTRQPRRGVDAQAEAYAMLLTDYCRFWHKAMPFMFEREGDYTELLIPANLLADDSVLSRAEKVLTPAACQDVEVIGWLYQFYISERAAEVFDGFKRSQKAGPSEIPAATQLFTPDWIVRYLVENSVGRLWMLNRPESRLVDRMEYYVPQSEHNGDFIRVATPEDLSIIDPACGSGHMLTYAFDLLVDIYEEEGYAPADIPRLILAKNLHGSEIDPRAASLAAFALAMKARARQRTFFSRPVAPAIASLEPERFSRDELEVLVEVGEDREAAGAFWNQFADADTVGALGAEIPKANEILAAYTPAGEPHDDLFASDVRARAATVVHNAALLSSRYHVVVANPPYMGARNMGSKLTDWLKAHYPSAKQDLYGAFVLRCMRMLRRGGLLAMITGDTWMTIKTFEDFRSQLVKERTFLSFLHLRDSAYHADTFGANAAFILSTKWTDEQPCPFIRLEPLDAEEKRARLLEAIRNENCDWLYRVSTDAFGSVPGAPFVYQLSEATRGAFAAGTPLARTAEPRQGLATGENDRFLRQWWEVEQGCIGFGMRTRDEALASGLKWFPCLKGGPFRKWYGNTSLVINWHNDGAELISFKPRSVIRNPSYYFKQGATWSSATSGSLSMRYAAPGSISESKGAVAYSDDYDVVRWVLGFANSKVAQALLGAISPTIDFHEGPMGRLPLMSRPGQDVLDLVSEAIAIAEEDWAQREEAHEFTQSPWLAGSGSSLATRYSALIEAGSEATERLRGIEESIQEYFIQDYELGHELSSAVAASEISLWSNPNARYGGSLESESVRAAHAMDMCEDLISYAVGCMFGRFSPDAPGLILADQGETLEDYLAKIESPTFEPDADNVIPIVDGDWFEDDVVGRFRQFLRSAFGSEHFEENLNFVTEALAVRNLRDYFITRAGRSKFYDDHVQRYKKRPIYWLFSSPKGSFNALVYMHRYTPSTVSTVLTYLREYVTKLEASLQQADRAGNAKEADRLRRILVELNEYEHDTLYPKASENVVIDLDDGVKLNYPKFGASLKKIAGLEASSD